MDETFEAALIETDEAYRKAEAGLVAGGPEAVELLRGHLADPRRLVRFIAETLLAVAEGRCPQYASALDSLDALEAMKRETPALRPNPEGVATLLTRKFGASVAEPLALRLAKELHWPDWKVYGVLLYLEAHKPAAIAPALLRFAVQTRNPRARQLALEIFSSLPEEDRQECLREEAAWLKDTRAFPPPEVGRLIEALDGEPIR
jgi:hypothetical protein